LHINNRDVFLPLAIKASLLAGDATLEVYEGDFEVEEKSDHSPLTLADRRSHEIIEAHLKDTNIPVLSEEGRDIPYEERRNWPILWIVDPLDGTKEFVKRNGEFTINIALIDNQRPVLGVIYVPVTGILYFAAVNYGSFCISRPDMPSGWAGDLQSMTAASRKLPLEKKDKRPYTIMGSRSHATPELSKFVDEIKNQHKDAVFVSAGSSLKFCRVAEGFADVYPRMGPTMEWDTAAGDAIAAAAGATVHDYNARTPLKYNKPDLLNPWFIVEKL
jgi:3'(2'), 5'-bisphosphate nucleotidase